MPAQQTKSANGLHDLVVESGEDDPRVPSFDQSNSVASRFLMLSAM